MENIDKKFQSAIAEKLGGPANGHALRQCLESASTESLNVLIDKMIDARAGFILVKPEAQGSFERITFPGFTVERTYTDNFPDVYMEVHVIGNGYFTRMYPNTKK